MMTRMNLNTFARHGVFEDKNVSKMIADRLRDREQVLNARAFPYQLMMAWKATENREQVPFEVRDALQDAMAIAIDNVPVIKGQVYICVDTSGSMSSSITGWRSVATSYVRCVDVASLFASCILRKNPDAVVLPFDTRIHQVKLNPRDTVITNAEKLARFGGGGTDCGCALAHINKSGRTGDAVIYVSDCESWVDSCGYFGLGQYKQSTGMATEWKTFKNRNKNARLVCIDLTPNPVSQVKEQEDTLLVGGFGDQCFDVIASFIEYGTSKSHWVGEIETISLD